jgi:ferredoxin
METKTLRPVIQVLEDKCINCHRCIMVCPVKMCNNGAGNIVDHHSDLCIGCGECISGCPHHARIGLDDFTSFMEDLKNGTGIIAIVAPAAAATGGAFFQPRRAYVHGGTVLSRSNRPYP